MNSATMTKTAAKKLYKLEVKCAGQGTFFREKYRPATGWTIETAEAALAAWAIANPPVIINSNEDRNKDAYGR